MTCSILKILSHQVPKESWNKHIKKQGSKPKSILPLASHLPAARSHVGPWLMPSFQPQKLFCSRVPYLSSFGCLGNKAILKNTTPVCSHPYFPPKGKSCCSSHALSSWEWETILKGWVEQQPLCWCPEVDVSPTPGWGGWVGGTMALLTYLHPNGDGLHWRGGVCPILVHLMKSTSGLMA